MNIFVGPIWVEKEDFLINFLQQSEGKGNFHDISKFKEEKRISFLPRLCCQQCLTIFLDLPCLEVGETQAT